MGSKIDLNFERRFCKNRAPAAAGARFFAKSLVEVGNKHRSKINKNHFQDDMPQTNKEKLGKSSIKRPKMAPRRSKTLPRRPQDVPRRPKTPPRRFQDAPKTAPRRPKDAPKTAQDLQNATRCPSRARCAPVLPPRQPQDVSREPKESPKIHFSLISA